MTPEQLKTELAAKGFRFGQDRLRDTGLDWYAWRTLSDAADCACNDRAPCLLIRPYKLEMDGRVWHSVEFEVTGEIQGESWITTKIYSVGMDQALDQLPKAERVLTSVWNTAATLIETGEPA